MLRKFQGRQVVEGLVAKKSNSFLFFVKEKEKKEGREWERKEGREKESIHQEWDHCYWISNSALTTSLGQTHQTREMTQRILSQMDWVWQGTESLPSEVLVRWMWLPERQLPCKTSMLPIPVICKIKSSSFNLCSPLSLLLLENLIENLNLNCFIFIYTNQNLWLFSRFSRSFTIVFSNSFIMKCFVSSMIWIINFFPVLDVLYSLWDLSSPTKHWP